MKRLCLLVPTRNHPDLMEYYLNEVIDGIKKYDIDVFIYDTSGDDSTNKLVGSFANRHIRYFHNDNYQDTTTDQKIVEGFEMLMDDYDYIWLCGDGYVPVLEDVMPKIAEYLDNAYDIIHFIPSKYIEGKKKAELDKISFFRDCGWYSPYYGTTIVSSAFFENTDLKKTYQTINNSGFLFWFSMYEALAKLNNERIIVFDCEGTFKYNPKKKTSAAARPGAFAKFWLDEWPKAIDSLPNCYDEYKARTCKTVGNETFFPDMYHFMIQRITNNISFSIIKKYKQNIPRLTDAPMWKFYLTAMVPVSLLKFMRSIRQKKKGNEVKS